MFVLHSRDFGNNKDLDINCIPSCYWSQTHSDHFPQGWICYLCPKVVTVSHSLAERFKLNACATCVVTKDVWLAVSKSTLILGYPSLLLGLVQFVKHHYCWFLCALCCPLTQHSLVHFLTLHLPWGFGTTNRRMMFPFTKLTHYVSSTVFKMSLLNRTKTTTRLIDICLRSLTSLTFCHSSCLYPPMQQAQFW